MQNSVDYNQKVLEIKNLRRYFKVGMGRNKLIVKAIDDVSFDIYKREVFGLVGESGCGKTTTGRTIIKLYSPTDGTITFEDVRIGAGFSGNIHRIKKAKEASRLEIIRADTYKSAYYDIEVEQTNSRKLRDSNIKQIKARLNAELIAIDKPLFDAKYSILDEKKADTLRVDEVRYSAIISQRNCKNDETKSKEDLHHLKVSNAHMIATAKEDSKKLMDTNIKNIVKSMPSKESLQQAKLKVKQKADADIKAENEKYNVLLGQYKERFAKLKADKQANPASYTINNDAILQSQANLKEIIVVEKQGIKKAKADNVLAVPKGIRHVQRVAIVESTNHYKAQKQPLNEKLKQVEKKSAEYDEIKQQIVDLTRTYKSEKAAIIASVIRDNDIMSRIQMIFQDPISSLNPRMIVREIIAEGLRIRGIHDRDVINEKVNESLKLVGLLPEHATRYPHEFSGGQRQRIGIARALIVNPEFIIADEPISALDVSIQAQIINLLNDLKDQLGLTILFIAHDLSVIKYFSDRIGVMYFGKLVELANSDELFANPLHPYTKSLLSAIPQPDPISEKTRERIIYDPSQHDYSVDKPTTREIKPGHLIYCNDKEFDEYKKQLGIK